MTVQSLLEKLLVLARQKEKLMTEILQVSKRLADSMEDWENFNKLLDVRQQYIEKINELDQQMQILQQKVAAEAGVSDWEGLKALHPEAVGDIEGIHNSSAQLALEAKKLTDHSRQLAEQKMNELKQKMQNMQTTKTGMTAYHKKGVQQDGYFVDKKK